MTQRDMLLVRYKDELQEFHAARNAFKRAVSGLSIAINPDFAAASEANDLDYFEALLDILPYGYDDAHSAYNETIRIKALIRKMNPPIEKPIMETGNVVNLVSFKEKSSGE